MIKYALSLQIFKKQNFTKANFDSQKRKEERSIAIYSGFIQHLRFTGMTTQNNIKVSTESNKTIDDTSVIGLRKQNLHSSLDVVWNELCITCSVFWAEFIYVYIDIDKWRLCLVK